MGAGYTKLVHARDFSGTPAGRNSNLNRRLPPSASVGAGPLAALAEGSSDFLFDHILPITTTHVGAGALTRPAELRSATTLARVSSEKPPAHKPRRTPG